MVTRQVTLRHTWVLLIVPFLLPLAGCEPTTPTMTTMKPEPPPAGTIPEPPAPDLGGGPPAAPGGSGGGSGPAPAAPSVVGNIVLEINTGAAPTRSSNIVSLPPIDGTRQEATIISETVRKTFPEDFTYAPDYYWERREGLPWILKMEAPSITQDFLNNGGTAIVTFSMNGGSEWLSSASLSFHPLSRWGYNESGGYVQIEMRHFTYSGFVKYACTTTETGHHRTSMPHHPTMTITEGAATATAEATIDNGVITAVGNIQHGSGTFTGTNIAYTWGTFWDEPQRGSGATFTFSVSGGQVTGVTVTNGGTGYRKPCNAADSYNPPSYYVDKTAPSYLETSHMRAALRSHGTEPLLIRFTIISP